MNLSASDFHLHLVRLLFVFISAAASFMSSGFEYGVLLEVLKALIGFSGVVVTIFGIWIAIIFPSFTSELAGGTSLADSSRADRYNSLISSLYRSCFSLTASFFVFLVASLHGQGSDFYSKSLVLFSFLVFFSIACALWSSVLNGEVEVVGQINDGILDGFKKRFSSRGKISR